MPKAPVKDHEDLDEKNVIETSDGQTLRIEAIDEIPEASKRRGPRNSECLRTFLAVKDTPTQKVMVTNEDPDTLEKFYKSMMQWKGRHKDEGVNVRKDGSKVYIWIENPRKK